MERDEVGMILKKQRTGDCLNFEGGGSSKVIVEIQSAAAEFSDKAVFRLYFKGLVSDQIRGISEAEKKTAMAGFGVAICDQTDKLLFELKEPVNEEINRKEVEIRALIRGLRESLEKGIRNVFIYCKDCEVYQMITGRCKPKKKEIVQLMEEVGRLRNKFASSEATLVARNDVKFAYKLARDAIVSQTSSADGDDNDDDDSDVHDHEDYNPGNGCECRFACGFDSPSTGFDEAAYIEYYSL